MKIEDALKIVSENLSNERFDHTVRVLNQARELASHYNVKTYEVELAAIFHDYAKEFDDVYLKNYIIEHRLDERLLLFHKELWHGPVASHILKTKYNITENEILNAVYYHTTGRANMDNVELIIFVADYIEPKRRFPGVEKVRRIAFEDIRKAALISLKNTIPYLIQKGATIFPDTFYAYNDLTLTVLGGKNNDG